MKKKTNKLYHGGLGKITAFSDEYAGDTTCDNPHGAFYFSNLKVVAEDYSVQAFKRRYGYSLECLVADNVIPDLPKDDYDADELVDELAHENINVTTAILTMHNPFIIDADYKNLRELELSFNIQNAIGFMKGNVIDEIPEQFIELIPYNEDDDEYEEIPEFDGIIILNVIDDIGDKSCVYQDVHIAINPNQIQITD